MKKSYIFVYAFKIILFTLYPIKVLGLTLETRSDIKYIGTYHNSIEQKNRLEISFNRWNGTNGSATLKTGPAIANLRVSATSNNTFRMLGTLQHQGNSWNLEANCTKYNLEIPSINCSYVLHPLKTDIYNQTISGKMSLNRHLHYCQYIPPNLNPWEFLLPLCDFHPY